MKENNEEIRGPSPEAMRRVHDEFTEAFHNRNRSIVYADLRLYLPLRLVKEIEATIMQKLAGDPGFEEKHLVRVSSSGLIRAEVIWEYPG